MKKFNAKRYILLFLLVLCCSMLVLGACKCNSCNSCKGSTQQQNPDSEHEHDYTESVTPATCTEDGVKIYTCDCGTSYDEVIPATGHSLKFVIEADGHSEKCENCDYTTEKVSHSYDEVVSTELSTCTDKGSKTTKCVCGDEHTEDLPLAEHKFTKVEYDEEGHYTVCAVCDVSDPNSTKQDHEYSSKVIFELTCTQNETTKFSCDCGYSYTETTAVATGHELDKTQFTKRTPSGHFYKCGKCGNEVLELHESIDADCPQGCNREATCYKEGHQDKQCTICELVYHETTPMTDDHNFSEEWMSNGTFHWHACLNGDGQCTAKEDEAQHIFVTVREEPTCTEPGHEHKQCQCGRIQSGSNRTLPAAGHNYEERVLKDATCSQTGEVQKHCLTCGETVTEQIPMSKHSWTLWDSDDSQHWHICANCNAVSTSKGNHNFRLVEAEAATCSANGYKLEVCTACEHEKRTILPAHHDYHATDVGRVDATCTEFGYHFEICDACGDTQKVVDEHLGYADHDIVYYPKKDATEDADGHINHWKCNVCGKYFSSKNCEQELTEDEVFIRAPKTHEVKTIAELVEIGCLNYVDKTSSDWYKITLTVLEVDVVYNYLWLYDDSEDDLVVYFDSDTPYNLSTIGEDDTVTIRGHLYSDGEDILLEDPQILAVDCGEEELVDLIFAITGDLDRVTLIAYSDPDEFYIVNYGVISKLYNYHCLFTGDVLTLSYQNNYGSIIVNTLVINGKSYTMAGGELTIEVTESLYIEIDFKLGGKATNIVTVDEIDTSWNAEVTVNPYISYTYVNGNNDSGHVVKNSYLKFYIENAYITSIEIEFENYELTSVAKNTIYTGRDESHKSAASYSLSGTVATLTFNKSDKLAYFEYSANASQARIASIKIHYETYNT